MLSFYRSTAHDGPTTADQERFAQRLEPNHELILASPPSSPLRLAENGEGLSPHAELEHGSHLRNYILTRLLREANCSVCRKESAESEPRVLAYSQGGTLTFETLGSAQECPGVAPPCCAQ